MPPGNVASSLDLTPPAQGVLARSLTSLDGISLVVGLQIGSGIFSASAAVCARISSPIIGMGIWFLAGLLGWAIASSFIELGIKTPENGGIQEYLRHCYGDSSGFLFAWVWILLIKPCSMAMIAFIFAEYVCRVFLVENREPSVWLLKGIALLTTAVITIVNCFGTKNGTLTGNFFLVVKFGSLGLVLIGAGFFQLGLLSSLSTSFQEVDFSSPRLSVKSTDDQAGVAGVSDALFAALFASGGWEAVGVVAGELENPSQTLPKVLKTSMFVIIPLTLLTNGAFYSVLTVAEIKSSNAVALTFGREIFGFTGAVIFTWLVALCCLGSLHATVFSLGRLTQAASTQGYIPRFFQIGQPRRVHPEEIASINDTQIQSATLLQDGRARQSSDLQDNIPRNAMLLNASISTFYVLAGTFRALTTLKGMADYLLYGAAVSTVLVARFRSPQTEASSTLLPYRTPLIYPSFFCLTIFVFVLYSAWMHTGQAISIIVLFGACICAYKLKLQLASQSLQD